MKKTAIGIITLLILTILMSGCISGIQNFGDDNNFNSSTREEIDNAINDYFSTKYIGENTTSSFFSGNVAIGKISETEAFVSVETNNQTWNGTWSYNGTNWNPNPDFKRNS